MRKSNTRMRNFDQYRIVDEKKDEEGMRRRRKERKNTPLFQIFTLHSPQDFFVFNPEESESKFFPKLKHLNNGAENIKIN